MTAASRNSNSNGNTNKNKKSKNNSNNGYLDDIAIDSDDSASASANSQKEKVISKSDLSSLVLGKNGVFRLKFMTGVTDSSPAAMRKFALKRLAYEAAEVATNELPMIAAVPMEDDIFEWHANLVGPPGSSYEDVCFHFIIKVPEQYPRKAPRVEIQSYFEHKNVFGKWICLDMLEGQWSPDEPKTQTTKAVGFGWTPAYTMQSILIQLQAFLFDAADKTSWAKFTEKHAYVTSTVLRARSGAKFFRCKSCPHTGRHPNPEPPVWSDRLRYMVPGVELHDIMNATQDLWTFLENISSLVNVNEWPAIAPMKPGSFFSWTLLPWYEDNFRMRQRIREESGSKQISKQYSHVIRGLVRRAINYLNAKNPKPPPSKSLLLTHQYRIESAIGLSVNFAYANKCKERERGYWQWGNRSILSLSKKSTKTGEEEEKNNNNSTEGGGGGGEEKSESKANGNGHGHEGEVDDDGEIWVDFPVRISQEIEALYLKWNADLRRPGELVEILAKPRDVLAREKKAAKRLRKQQKQAAKNANTTPKAAHIETPKSPAAVQQSNRNKNKNKKNKSKKNKSKSKSSNNNNHSVAKKTAPQKAVVGRDTAASLKSNTFANGKRYGVVTYPQGHHWHRLRAKDLTRAQMAQIYVPYSGNDPLVRVMPVSPLKTWPQKVMCWQNGPLYTAGRKLHVWRKYDKLRIEENRQEQRLKPKLWKYKRIDGRYLNSVVVDRYQDKYGVFYFVCHPMPSRIDIQQNSSMRDVNTLKIVSEGKFYKSYVRGDDDKHYVIDIQKSRVRCIEDACVYKIRRRMKTKGTNQLWQELMKLTAVDECETDVPWGQPIAQATVPLPHMDYRKYLLTAFIDIAIDAENDSNDEEEAQFEGRDATGGERDEEYRVIADEVNDDDDEDADENEHKQTVVPARNTNNNSNTTRGRVNIPVINFPCIDDKVMGRVVEISRNGLYVEIGYSNNLAFLHISNIKCSKKMLKTQISRYKTMIQDYEQRKQKQEAEEKRVLNQFKRQKRKRKKLATKLKKERERKEEEQTPQSRRGVFVQSVGSITAEAAATANIFANQKHRNAIADADADTDADTDTDTDTEAETNTKPNQSNNNRNQKQKQKQNQKQNKNKNTKQKQKQTQKQKQNKKPVVVTSVATMIDPSIINGRPASTPKKKRRRRRSRKAKTNENENENGNENQNERKEDRYNHRNNNNSNNYNNNYNNQRNRNQNQNYSNNNRNSRGNNGRNQPQRRRATELRRPRFTLAKTIDLIQDSPLDIGDCAHFYVDAVSETAQNIWLSQFRPLSSFEVGEHVQGTVRSVLSYAAFVDIGCKLDAFLHKTSIEFGLQNRIVFDCMNEVAVGQRLKLRVSSIDLDARRLEVQIDTSAQAPDRLTMPDDFDESQAVRVSIFGLLPDDLNELIFQFMDRASLHRCRDVCRLFTRVIDDRTSLKWDVAELKCFHSKDSFADGQVILGFGVRVERYPNSAMICAIEPRLDLLSAQSFASHQVRLSVWKLPFSNWLPVYINAEHGRRSFPWAKRMIAEMMSYGKRVEDWNPYHVIKIIPALMNTMIVKVMKGELHESIVALEGYTMFYHLMLAFILEYPFLQEFIDKNIGRFLLEPEYRTKKKVPSLGEFICLLSVSNKYTWRDVATSYLRECFDRHVKWILGAHKALLDPKAPKRARLHKSFLASQVSLKLCMFHVCFLRLFRYSQRSGTVMTVEQTKKKLDSLYGRPTHNMKLQLQHNVKRIKKIKSWPQFFEGVGVKCPSEEDMYSWLLEALRNSEDKRYHRRYWFLPKRKKKTKDLSGGAFDKYDMAGEAWSAKQFGSSAQEAILAKTKKMSVGDQMMASF